MLTEQQQYELKEYLSNPKIKEYLDEKIKDAIIYGIVIIKENELKEICGFYYKK